MEFSNGYLELSAGIVLHFSSNQAGNRSLQQSSLVERTNCSSETYRKNACTKPYLSGTCKQTRCKLNQRTPMNNAHPFDILYLPVWVL